MRDGEVQVHYNLTKDGERISSCVFGASLNMYTLPERLCAPGYVVSFRVDTDGTICTFLMECKLPSGASHSVEATIPVNLRKFKEQTFTIADGLVLRIGANIRPTEENSKWLRKMKRRGARLRAERDGASATGGVVYQILWEGVTDTDPQASE
jgi:hypothetical protein